MNFRKLDKKHWGPIAAVALGVVFLGALIANAPACEVPTVTEKAPPPPPPCKDVKLNALTTEECPHKDHILETHVLQATVCRCKGNIKEKKDGWLDF
jgi:hypothetical protein